MLEWPESPSTALSNDLLKLEFLDFSDEFNLESFPFLEDADSEGSWGSSRVISEMTMSFVEVLTLALVPSEPRLMEREIRLPLVQSGSADLGFTWIKVDTGNLSVGDVSLFASTLGMMLGHNMVHHEMKFCQLCQGNYLPSTWAVWMSRHGSSSYLPQFYLLLGWGQVCGHIFMQPTADRNDLGWLRECLQTTVMSELLQSAGSWLRNEFSWSHLSFMIWESNAWKPRPVGLDDSIKGGNTSNTTHFMILKGIKVLQITKHRSQKLGPIMIGLNRDLLLHITRISCFIEPAEVGSLLKEFNADQIHDSWPTSMRMANNPSLLLHFGTVIKSPIWHTLYELFKPLLVIAQDVSRVLTEGRAPSNSMQASHWYLSSDAEVIQYLIYCLKRSIYAEWVNILVEAYRTTGYESGFGTSLDVSMSLSCSLGGIVNYDGTYASYQITAKWSRELSSGTPIEIHGDTYISATECHRSVSSMEAVELPPLVRERLRNWNTVSNLALDCDSVILEKQRPSKVRYIIESESALLREVRSYHFGMKLGSHGVFWMLGWPNMVTIYWIGHIHLCIVEPREVRLPDDRHACWKKRCQKGVGVMLDPIYGSSYWVFNHLIWILRPY